MNTNAQLVIKDLIERGARFSLVDGDRILVAPPELLTDEDRASIRAHKDGIISILKADKPENAGTPDPIHACEDASHAMPDPVPAIEAAGRAQAAVALIQLCMSQGIGIAPSGDGLIVYSNNRLWGTLAEALSRHAAAIAVAMPGQIGITSVTLKIVGRVLDRPPGPVEIARPVIEPLPPWMGGGPDSEQKEAWIVAALKAARQHHSASDPGWTSEQLERARQKLGQTLEPGDQVESASNYKIIVAKRGGEKVEVLRYDA